MARKHRSRGYDIDPDEITRPDMVPAAQRFAEDEADASQTSVTALGVRELAPYPGIAAPLPAADERTVSYGPLPPVTAPPSRPSYEQPPHETTSVQRSRKQRPETTAVPRSGTRHRAPEPLPMRETQPSTPRAREASRPDTQRRRAEPSRPDTQRRRAEPSRPDTQRRRAEPSRPDTQRRRAEPLREIAPPPPLATRGEKARLVLLAALIAVVGASIGTILGNGSFEHVVDRLLGPHSEKRAAPAAPPPAPMVLKVEPQPAAAVVAPASSAAVSSPRLPSPASAARPAAAAEPSRAPVMRFEDLPRAEREATEESPEQARVRERPAKSARRKQR